MVGGLFVRTPGVVLIMGFIPHSSFSEAEVGARLRDGFFGRFGVIGGVGLIVFLLDF
jgi:hypothetical protein